MTCWMLRRRPGFILSVRRGGTGFLPLTGFEAAICRTLFHNHRRVNRVEGNSAFQNQRDKRHDNETDSGPPQDAPAQRQDT